MEYAVICLLILYIFLIEWFHRKEKNEMLNRFMARNLTELQANTKKPEVQRSETGNFFLDNMQKAARFYQNNKTLDE